ncbi:MAG: FAD-dependent oxidoreductase [Methanomassiliicoccales archaeon]|nr:FAD-dependent oxidoreductase [Methanomassiliicoccales archaeon]
MSAAVYAARKGLDVLLLSQSLGGQVNYTARVDNYLGVPEISGPEMVEAFREHAESYEIAEDLGDPVEAVLRDKGLFQLRTKGGKGYMASTVVYCGGKEYKRLGAKGEERLMGKGVAFCATCDAPLYQGKSVAVVGGGNSAFTALRDLLAFASRIYLVHRRRDFKADPPLAKEVLGSGKVVVLTPFVVLEFQGKESLEFMVIKDVETAETMRLEVAGAFLEIGMEAKAEPIRDLLRLNQHGEVPVRKDMSTEVEGLFAAGDVTDTEEKQISIAVGQGAQAALSAHRYLMERGLASKVPAKDPWI